MNLWIGVALLGGVLALSAVARRVALFRRGQTTSRSLLATIVILLSFSSFALLDTFRPRLAGGAASLAVLLPGLAALVVLLRANRKRRESDHPRR